MTRAFLLHPPHTLLIFVAVFVNNVAFTSPQQTGVGPPNLKSVPPTSFSCAGRPAGYYADPETQCQAYHMCGILEQKYSYLCPGYTLFNQKFMVCDHWHAVDCAEATQYYDLNEKIGQVSKNENEIHERETTTKGPKLSSIFKINNVRTTPSTETAILSQRFDAFPATSRREPREQNNRILRKTTEDELGRRAPPQLLIKSTSSTSPLRPVPSPPTTTTLKPFRTSPSTTTLKPFRTSPSTTTAKPFTFRTSQPTTPAPRQTRRPTFRSQTERKTTLATTTPFPPPPPPPRHSFTIAEPKLSISLKGKPIKGVSIKARGSGLKVKFGRETKRPLNEAVINGVKFRPLFNRPQTAFLDDRNFTLSPDAFTTTTTTTTPASALVNQQNDNDDKGFISLQEDSSPIEPILPFLLPPFVEEPIRSSKFFPTLSPFLIPPPRGPVILHGDNQEILTPLVVTRIRPLGLRPRQFLPPQSHNLDFFIPAPGLLPPLPDNTISDHFLPVFNDDKIQSSRMTMTFPNTTSIRRRRPLVINPNCPRCHPAFLRPNSCQPCVIIK